MKKKFDAVAFQRGRRDALSKEYVKSKTLYGKALKQCAHVGAVVGVSKNPQ